MGAKGLEVNVVTNTEAATHRKLITIDGDGRLHPAHGHPVDVIADQLHSVVVLWDLDPSLSWLGSLTTSTHHSVCFSAADLEDPVVQKWLRALPGWEHARLWHATTCPGHHLVWQLRPARNAGVVASEGFESITLPKEPSQRSDFPTLKDFRPRHPAQSTCVIERQQTAGEPQVQLAGVLERQLVSLDTFQRQERSRAHRDHDLHVGVLDQSGKPRSASVELLRRHRISGPHTRSNDCSRSIAWREHRDPIPRVDEGSAPAGRAKRAGGDATLHQTGVRGAFQGKRCVGPTWMVYGLTDTMPGWVGNTQASNGPSSSSW